MNEQGKDCRKQPRNIAFDILRLIAMLMVTMLHITGHGVQGAQIKAFSGAYWITLFLNTFSLVAVNCFVLISGYFLSAKKVSMQKLLPLWLQVWTYSVTLYILLCFIPGSNVSFRFLSLIECAFPLLSNQYWFFTCYFLMYLLAPVLNKLAETWNQKEYQKTLFIMFFVFSVIPSVNIWADSFGTNRGYSLIWFVVLYLIAAYVRRFGFRCPMHPAVAYLVPCTVLCVLRVAVSLWNPDKDSIYALLSNQCSYNGPLILCASIGIFLWARNASLKTGKRGAEVIATVGSLSFGIYLLHDHGSIRKVLWNEWVRLTDVIEYSGTFFLRIILVLFILVISGLAAEFVRKKIITGIFRILHNTK